MRDTKIQVMMTKEEVKILDQIAANRGLSRSALLRQLLLKEAQEAQRAKSQGAGTTTPPHGDQ